MVISKRDESVEVFRCLLMFGIVLLHCVSQGPIVLMLPYHVLMACVTGFVFISGYFGIRFTWHKCLLLLVTCLLCKIVADIIFPYVFMHVTVSLADAARCCVQGSWFVWSYMVLMAFAPMIERALPNIGSDKSGARFAVPLLFLVFGRNHCCSLPYLAQYLPRPAGFGTHTFLMMIGVYLAARLLRIYDVESRLGWKSLSVAIAASGCLCAAGFSHYDSPVSFVFMASLFFAVKRMHFGVFGKVAVFLGPSMLSVYLIHWSAMGIYILNRMECGGGGFGKALLTASVLFALSVAIDVPRRCLWYVCNKLVK